MKASHRKDVIIARLIFAAICLFLIALIVTIVITVNSKGGKKKEQDKVQQNAVSESETDSAGDSDTEIGAIYLPQQTTEGTEKTYVTTTSSVNMREKPDKNANIVTVIGQNVKLEFVSEDNGGHRLSSRDRQAMSALTTSSQIWLTALQTAAHQVRQIAGLPVRVQQMAVQQELQIVLHSHSNRYVVR